MRKDNFLVGLEIGTYKVCVVIAEVQEDETLYILGIGEAGSRGVRKGEVIDFDAVQICIREALADAEAKSNIGIGSVWLGVTGSHIKSVNHRGSISISEDEDGINEEHLAEVENKARDVALSNEDIFLHAILQRYIVDGQSDIQDPMGMIGSRLEADYHLIYGSENRLKNAIRCVKEISLEVEDVVPNALASAFAILTAEHKQMGTLLIDMGEGTMDWVVFIDGKIVHSGVLAIGGDHITNDISMGLRIPRRYAERLKIKEGSASVDKTIPGDMIVLGGEDGFAGGSYEREMLNQIIHMRLQEALELLKKQVEREVILERLSGGIVLTGGGSLLKDVGALVEEIFGCPVSHEKIKDIANDQPTYQEPRYATAIGLVKYGHIVSQERIRPSVFDRLGNFIQRFFESIIGIFKRGNKS